MNGQLAGQRQDVIGASALIQQPMCPAKPEHGCTSYVRRTSRMKAFSRQLRGDLDIIEPLTPESFHALDHLPVATDLALTASRMARIRDRIVP